MTLLYESAAGENSSVYLTSSPIYRGQQWTPKIGYKLLSIKLKLSRQTTSTGYTATVDVKALDGNGKPTGSVLASGSKSFTDIPYNSYNVIEFVMATPYIMTGGTKYGFYLRTNFASTSMYVRYANNGDYYAGHAYLASNNSGSTWTVDSSGYDLWFQIWAEWPHIAKINGIDVTAINKVLGASRANIAKINGIAV